MKFTTYLPIFLLIFIGATLFSCQQETVDNQAVTEEESLTDELGEISFEVTGDEAAKPYFKNGLLLLHSFEYEDAREEFLKAQEIDSTFAMAYWGEAMTYNHSLWQRQEKEKAEAALARLAPTAEERMAFVETDLEKDFLGAIEVLYGEGTKYERDVAYKEHLSTLREKYPDNHEVSAFYAISLLGASRNGRDDELYNQSARIVQGIIKENPKHPGALHYLIHSFDDPDHAAMAKNAADSYSKVAPDAAHALHMPSHIYVALGDWDNVVTCNVASWNASIKRMQRKELDNSARSYHAFHWLQYGLLQKGDTAAATDLLKLANEYVSAKPEKRSRIYLLGMKGAQLVETGDWTSELAELAVKTDDLNWLSKGQNNFIEGMKAYAKNDIDSLTKVIENMTDNRGTMRNLVGETGFAMCSAAGYANQPPNELDINMVQVMEMELRAYLATLQKDNQAAADWFEQATALDEGLNYSFGPPRIFKPVHEAYGEWLLENGDAQLAMDIFAKALKRQPRRLRSLKGKQQAAQQLAQQAIVAEVDTELKRNLAELPTDELL
ncbi:MAG: hypothetical protein AB8G22_14400 [Saprospiraceae bacterium]